MFLKYKILQPHHFINTSINPDSGHTSNYTRQNEVNVANEHLKVENRLLESLIEWINFPCYNQKRTFPRHKLP